jgi:hypothetical protein
VNLAQGVAGAGAFLSNVTLLLQVRLARVGVGLISPIVAALALVAAAGFRDAVSAAVKVAAVFALMRLADEVGCLPGKCGPSARDSYRVQVGGRDTRRSRFGYRAVAAEAGVEVGR